MAVYLILGVLYESAIHPLTIISTPPSAGVGALHALMLCGQDLFIMEMIGIILLIGIVKKEAIMMTTLAALFGALPLVLRSGAGAELRVSLGIAIVGGLSVSQMLTLFTTLVVHLWFDRLSHCLAERRAKGDMFERESVG